MLLTKADKILIGIVLLVALGGIALNITRMSTGSEQVAQIYQDGKLVQTIPLRQGYRQELRLGGANNYNLIQAQNDRIRIAAADCPDQICVLTGWVSTAPQEIVCLPHRVVIKIVSAKPPDIDDIAK